MKKVRSYIRAYLEQTDKVVLVAALCFLALGIFFNYHFHLNHWVSQQPPPTRYLYWYGVFLLAFSWTHFFYAARKRHRYRDRGFYLLLFLAPLLFSWKMVYDTRLSFTVAPVENLFWNAAFYYPFRFLVLACCLF